MCALLAIYVDSIKIYYSHEVQLTLLRGCWPELFALGLAQCSQTLSLSTIITALINHLQASIGQEKYPAVKIQRFTEHIVMLQVNIVLYLQQIAIDFLFCRIT